MKFRNLRTDRLVEATKIAEEFSSRFKQEGIIGIVFLGGIARGYFDKFSDIDIIIFKRENAEIQSKEEEIMYKGFWIDYSISSYEKALEEDWNMVVRWSFSKANIFYDPEEKIKDLLDRKVPLKPKERKQMMIQGMTLSKYFCNRVSKSWVHRGDILSAHNSINTALDELLKTLFALNNELVPSVKWKIFLSKYLKWLPNEFSGNLNEILLLKDFSVEELRRRKKALNFVWKQILPKVEEEVRMKFEKFQKLV